MQQLQKMVMRSISDPNKRKYLLILLACGALLMLLPGTSTVDTEPYEDDLETTFSVNDEEKRLGEMLSAIHGAGKCRVLLSLQAGAELVLAEDEGETVIVSSGGRQSTVTIQKRSPKYLGAVVVAEGSRDANVRYDILSAVMSYTGLGADKITICPLKD